MKILIVSLVFSVAVTSEVYSQTSLVFHQPDFQREIKKPVNIEQAKDVFQGTWALNLKSESGEIVDTVIVEVRKYSTRTPNLIIFSSVAADSLTNELSPDKVTFFQSAAKSTIEFKTADKGVVKFDGVLKSNLSIDAKAVTWTADSFSGYTLEATKITDDLGTTWVCGNDDKRAEGQPPHGRHATRSSMQMKSLTDTNKCTNWHKSQDGN